MPTDQAPPAPRETPLFSTGKKIIFLGALVVWGGFFLPWFPTITITGPALLKTADGFLPWKPALVTQTAANLPGGAEIPFLLGWLILGMAFLIVILPDAWPALNTRRVKLLSLCTLIIGAALLAFLVAHNPAAIKNGLLCNIAGYALLLIGIMLPARRTDGA